MNQRLQDQKSQRAGGNIVEHYAQTLGQGFQLADRRRLENVERSKKYKTCEQALPGQGRGDESDELSCDLVNDDDLRVFNADGADHGICGGDSDKRDQKGAAQCDRPTGRSWKKARENPP